MPPERPKSHLTGEVDNRAAKNNSYDSGEDSEDENDDEDDDDDDDDDDDSERESESGSASDSEEDSNQNRAVLGPLNEEQHMKVLKNKIIEFWQELKKFDGKKTDKDRDDLFQKYQPYIAPQTRMIQKMLSISFRNVLYRLSLDNEEVQEAPWLVQRLVGVHPELLDEKDDSKSGPLLKAVRRKMVWFIEAVLDSGIEDESLRRILGPNSMAEVNERKGNCIQSALAEGLDQSVTIRLINKASGYTLADQDALGMTPLHHAVNFDKCMPGQLELVMALIRHGDGAFDKCTDKPDKLSVYRYHLETQQKYLESQRKRKASKSRSTRPKKGSVGSSKQTSAAASIEKLDARRKKSQDNIKADSNCDENLLRQTIQRSSTGDTDGKVYGPTLEGMPPKMLKKREEAAANAAATNTTSNTPILRRPSLMKSVTDDRPQSPRDQTHTLNSANVKRTLSNLGQSKSTTGLAEKANSTLSPKARSDRPNRPKSSRSSTSNTTIGPSNDVAEKIARELKLHYLRSTFRQAIGAMHENGYRTSDQRRNHDSAQEFLYGDNIENKQICFAFPAKPMNKDEEINYDGFERAYKQIAFDPVLIYVEFRHLVLESRQDPRADKEKKKHGAGRRDMLQLFKWLSKDKGVKYILKVTVEDMEGIPHGDQAIIDSLALFEIEVLEWRKIDLCPVVLQKASNSIGSESFHEIHLWWSGNNGVLRSWSEPDGLTKLIKLKRIHLYEANPSLDSTAYRDANVSHFKQRLNDAREFEGLPKISVEFHPFHIPDDQSHLQHDSETPLATEISERKIIDQHEWLRIMDTFAEGLGNLKPPSIFPPNHLELLDLPKELKKEVTVALIDDGVNFMHEAVSDKLGPGKSFGSGFEEHYVMGAPEPYHGSSTGHGTVMAYMIGRICPAVKIYVCKIDMLRRKGAKATFTAKSAADAVEHAVKLGFDIISMSWTIQRDESKESSNKKDIDRLQKALEEAAAKNILLFCSAPDVGASNLENSCPFHFNSVQRKFKIGAAKADGKIYGMVGKNVDFILPGENVEMKENDKISQEDDTPSTGSSVATALAAGLAALIIYCVRQGAIYNYYAYTRFGREGPSDSPTVNGKQGMSSGPGVSERTLRVIKSFNAMKDAFNIISSKGKSNLSENDPRLAVEGFFINPGKALRNSRLSNEEKWAKIAGMARELVPDSTEYL